MAYQAHWTQADQSGRICPSQHQVRAVDVLELCEAVNRRRQLAYLWQDDFSSQAGAGLPVRWPLLAGQLPPGFTNLRFALHEGLVNATPGLMGGDPPSPARLEWLWPVADADQGKTIVNGFLGAGSGEVSLFAKLNGGTYWTDPSLAAGLTSIRAVHINEMRQVVEWLRRGRWTLPVYLPCGLLNLQPDMPWLSNALFLQDQVEIRSLGFAIVATTENPPRGLIGVTARDGSAVRVTADCDCAVEIYRCRREVDFYSSLPTWNQYNPGASGSWQTPGALGASDAAFIGTLACLANVPATFSGPTVAAAAQCMIDGQPQNLIFRRGDSGEQLVNFTAELAIEFDLPGPPN